MSEKCHCGAVAIPGTPTCFVHAPEYVARQRQRFAKIKANAKPKLVIALDQPDISWLIAKVERQRAALRTVRPADPAPGAEGLLRGDWELIKEVWDE